jgi:hypothetical protein
MSNDTFPNVLRGVSGARLVEELIARGALRLYGIDQYIPGIVASRYEGGTEQLEKIAKAQAVQDTAKMLVSEGILSFSTAPATERNPSAPPNDVIVGAQFLTLDPKYDLEGDV